MSTPDQPTATATPRTDANAGFVLDSSVEYPQEFDRSKGGTYVTADFARALERALAEAKAEVVRLKAEHGSLSETVAEFSKQNTALYVERDQLLTKLNITDPDGKPYHHDPLKARAAKLAAAEGDGPVSNETARAYIKAYPPTELTALRARGETSAALHNVAMYALDLTLTVLTTDGVPDDLKKRAYVAHRQILQYRQEYDLRSRAEVQRGERDPAIDAPNHRAYPTAEALEANAERLAEYYRTNPDVKAWLGDLSR